MISDNQKLLGEYLEALYERVRDTKDLNEVVLALYAVATLWLAGAFKANLLVYWYRFLNDIAHKLYDVEDGAVRWHFAQALVPLTLQSDEKAWLEDFDEDIAKRMVSFFSRPSLPALPGDAQQSNVAIQLVELIVIGRNQLQIHGQEPNKLLNRIRVQTEVFGNAMSKAVNEQLALH